MIYLTRRINIHAEINHGVFACEEIKIAGNYAFPVENLSAHWYNLIVIRI